ncbi:hypothetical protein L484_002408 [Morus notabilis]|uniref:HhH-GPD domain-containing protein n=1 Tax=Morus notabilis TaxID=981085 RepID=W9SPQ6_9ROSA|nr:uncharacterized protein LOC21385979 [Morus notabilis]EXC47697.1 hypothetical protein L484_002408 [Morus notabilis]
MEVSLELPLGDAAATFRLETAVCSHGLFMMAPNQWDPLSKTLLRPLRLTLHHHHWNPQQQQDDSVMARISQPHDRLHCLRVLVHAGTRSLTSDNKQALLAQVSRMLRLSQTEERICREFSEVYGCGSGLGRVFRSPTLFEDMVKCILLCNCQWPRTLSMAQALCDLQRELQLQSVPSKTVDFVPKTPAGKEPKRKVEKLKASTCLTSQFDAQSNEGLESHSNDLSIDISQPTPSAQNLSPSSLLSVPMENVTCEESYGVDSASLCNPQILRDREFEGTGDFPTPTELAKLDEKFLAKRCKLGYRAGRILKLARGIVEGRIQLRELEETCMERSLCSYSKLAVQLRQIDGFGPFTCANVLMCMGFYHVIPSDSETIRHLQQVHGRNSTVRTIERDVQQIYAKYEPFQFLAYWSELWHFYEKKFGKISEMPCSAYKLFTASNMKTKAERPNNRKKTADKPPIRFTYARRAKHVT